MTEQRKPQDRNGAGKGRRAPGSRGGSRRPKGQGTLIAIVLDKSGSMDIVCEATISGFNEFKGDQLRAGQDALVSLTLFDTQVHEVCSAIPLRELNDLDHGTYRPDGGTALYDAVGATINRIERLLGTTVVRPDRVLFAIITDGEENASREYDRRRVFDMIREREQAGWAFVFMGANMDSYAASETVGVQAAARARNWGADPDEMRRNMRVFSNATTRFRGESAPAACMESRAFFSPEDEAAADE
ncbi:MAG: vWA domain-containing protein [Coriobacteriia bacterium]|nr:vWA domain-containing protein [Coriobacteriia bacterium]